MIRLKDDINNYQYLQYLSEETLLRNFYPMWQTNIEFANLSEDDKFTLISLKLQYLTSL